MSDWPARLGGLSAALAALGVRADAPFARPELVTQALTHSSYASERNTTHNERLEMLGDAVVGFLVAELLFESLDEAREGVLTRARATLVDERGLAQRARSLRLPEWLALGKGAVLTGENQRPSVLAGAFEAVVAALYLSEGLDVARALVTKLFAQEARELASRPAPRDHKTLLQERTQALWHVLPTYRIVSEEGPDHDRTFVAEVTIDGRVAGRGTGATKKAAQQEAARLALASLEGVSTSPADR